MKKARPARAKEVVTVDTDDTTCPICYAEFLEAEDLEIHTLQVHPPPPAKLVSCQFCEKTFQNAEEYVLHFRDNHLADIKCCNYCFRVFVDTDAFRKHQVKHTRLTPKNKYSCSHCKMLFASIYELSEHEFEKHPSGEGVFLNKYYSLLSSVINMKADNVIQAIGTDFIYICAHCKHSDADLEGYIAHLKVNDCRSLACDKCFKVYDKRRILWGHFHKNPHCNNIAPKKKKCRECHKYFEQKTLKQHLKVCKSIRCSSCNMLFETLYELSEHQTTEHPLAVALLVCTFCRKECVGKIALDKHMERTHSHQLHLYKYNCSYCDVTFKHPRRLFAHYFLKHKDLEPYNCNICNKKFRIRKNFTLHIKLVHSSNGFVEFDEKLHVFFTDKKSEKPFQPVSKYVVEQPSHSNNPDETTENDKNKELELVNVNCDFMNLTETEGNQTDANQDTEQRKLKRKTKRTIRQDEIDEIKLTDDVDSEDEPLLLVRKKAKLKSKLKSQLRNNDRKRSKNSSNSNLKTRFTCKICKKYCYTFQNYHNHISMHFKDESKRCVKCSLSFKCKEELDKHLVEQHSSSKLTETLKKLLERRKMVNQKEEVSMTKKFLNTIKKVKFDKDYVTATLKPVTKEISVQKFIENFTPETNENKGIQITENISITKVVAPKRQPLIKMSRFKPAPIINEDNIKLAMPVRFKKVNEKHSVTIRQVEVQEYESKLKFDYEDDGQYQDDYNNDEDYCIQEDNKESYIPEVEQEVTLEGTEEVPKRNAATHKIVIPKLPKELKSIRIAHLLPEAPYYKIVKMNDIINTPLKKGQEEPAVNTDKDTPVQLPDGTKLVHVNPLAHLLGNTPIENIMKSNNKYYKTKNRNFQDAVAKAMQKLENTKRQTKKRVAKPKEKKTESQRANTGSVDNKVEIEINETSIQTVEIENNETSKETVEIENNEPSKQTVEIENNETSKQTLEISGSLPIIADD